MVLKKERGKEEGKYALKAYFFTKCTSEMA